jgi:hypothetical protein
MKIRVISSVFMLVSLVILISNTSVAQSASNVNISGLVYSHYYYDLSAGAQDKNGFELSRLYLTYRKNLSENILVRITTDIGRVSNDQEKQFYRLFLKYAYLELRKPSWKVKLLAGLHYVPLLAFQEEIWGYRSIAKMLTDFEQKQTSSDLGLKIVGQLPRDFGEYAVSFVNGEGYNQAEIGKHKGLYGRLTLRPLPAKFHGLRLTGFASHIQHDQNNSTNVITGFTSLESKHINLGAELSAGNDQINNQRVDFLGYSVYSIFKITSKWSLIGRLDWFDPDKQTKKDSHFRKIIGIGYKIHKDVELILDYQGVRYDEGVLNSNSDILFTHLYFIF